MRATAAEVQLIQPSFAAPARLYAEAVAMAPGQTDSHRSTYKQALLLLDHLAPSPAAQVRTAFAHLAPEAVAVPP